jgi:hypothetical protein
MFLSVFEGIPFNSSWSEMCGRTLSSLSAAYYSNNAALQFRDQGKIKAMSSKSVIHIQAPPGSVWEVDDKKVNNGQTGADAEDIENTAEMRKCRWRIQL